jgi:hypothetical protein
MKHICCILEVIWFSQCVTTTFLFMQLFSSMNIALQYVNDSNGNTHAIQITLRDWKKVVSKLKKYEQALRLQSDLATAFENVTALQKNNKQKQSLDEFLNEL